MRHHEQDPTRHDMSIRTTVSSYDWSRFGRHRLRAPAGALIDSPLGFHTHGWLATIWPSEEADGGWARLLWQSGGQLGSGWVVPARLAGGDVIEFGADRAEHPVRWYGILDTYDAVEWLTIQGPYDDPRSAHDDAQRLLANLRYQPPLRARAVRVACTRSRGAPGR